jgi:hypothetical protein
VWAVLLLLALAYVGTFASKIPFYDDWVLVPVLTGSEPLSATFLWKLHNEHRLPLPKLLLVAVGKLSGGDLRAGMFVNVALMGALAFAMLRTVRRVRGSYHFADAFFPAHLLGLGQWESFLMGFPLNLVGATAVAGACLALVARSRPAVSPRRAVLLGGCLVLLPLLGASGLALTPALASWLAFVGIRHCRAADGRGRRRGVLIVGLAALALLLVGLYFVGFHSHPDVPRVAKGSALISCAGQVLSMAWGLAGGSIWPFKAWAVLGLLLASGAVWLAAWRRRPQERVVLLGFLAFLLGMGCLVGAVAWGRAGFGGRPGLALRYVTLVLPLTCWLYFLWERYGGAGAPLVRTGLFVVAVLFVVADGRIALSDARAHGEMLRAFAADLAARMPPVLLAERYADRVYPATLQEDLHHYIRLLRDAHIGDFRQLPEDPPLREAPLSAVPSSLHDMTLAGGAALPVGPDPFLVFRLPQAQFVYAIRLHYVYRNPTGCPDGCDLFWKAGAGTSCDEGCGTRVMLEPGSGAGAAERTATVWVNAHIDHVRLVPKATWFRLSLRAIDLLLPDAPPDGGPP